MGSLLPPRLTFGYGETAACHHADQTISPSAITEALPFRTHSGPTNNHVLVVGHLEPFPIVESWIGASDTPQYNSSVET